MARISAAFRDANTRIIDLQAMPEGREKKAILRAFKEHFAHEYPAFVKRNGQPYDDFSDQLGEKGLLLVAVTPEGKVSGFIAGVSYPESKTISMTYTSVPKRAPQSAAALEELTNQALDQRGIVAEIFELAKEGHEENPTHDRAERNHVRKSGGERVPINYRQPVDPDDPADERIDGLALYAKFRDPNLKSAEKAAILNRHFVPFFHLYDAEDKSPENISDREQYAKDMAAKWKDKAPAADAAPKNMPQ